MDSPVEMMFHLERVVPAIGLPIYWTDLNAAVIGANAAFMDIVGIHQRADLLNKKLDDCLPGCQEQGMDQHVRHVIESKQASSRDETVQDLHTGSKRSFTVTRSPLIDADGAVVGVIAMLVELGAEQLDQKLVLQQARAEELRSKEEFTQLAHKVAHDMRSPLAALSIMLTNCAELDEARRLIFKNAFAALTDIANNILNRFNGDDKAGIKEELRCGILCSDFLLKLVSERKCQFQHLPVKFEMDIAQKAQFAFIRVQSSQFGRAVSNIINNAIEALNDKPDARLSIRLDADDEFVTLQIKDNGGGMPPHLVKRIMQRESFTSGKEGGHGLGMMQVWDMVEANEAQLRVESEIGCGTVFELVLRRTEKAEWVIDEIDMRYDDIVVILDDDQLIHDAWDLRIKPFMQIHPEMQVRHERNGRAVLDFVAGLGVEDKQRVFLFCDFELLNQDMNGLQVIEACGLDRVFLVTSYYYMAVVQKSASELGVKILPKQMALVTPLFCTQRYGILKINVDHVVYDKNFYSIEQLLEKYGATA